MHTQTLDNNKQSVLDFMAAANEQKQKDDAIAAHNALPEIKLRKIGMVKNDAVNTCLNNVFGTIYKKSLPVNDLLNSQTCVNGCIRRYVNPVDLEHEIQNFISNRCGGKNTAFYIHEALRRNPNNHGVKALIEGVEKIVNDQYREKELHPETITDDDYEFKITPDTQNKIDDLVQSLELDDLSEVIKSNVKTTAVNEINAARQEKEDRMKLEEELSLNNDVSTESAIDNIINIRKAKKDPFYQPSLFEGVMISKYNTVPQNQNEDLFVEEVSVFTEGVVKLIKDYFKAKNEASVQRMIASNLDSFKNSLVNNYKSVYSMYKGSADLNSHDKILDVYKKAQTSRRVHPDVKISLLDLDIALENIEDNAAKNKAVLKDLKHGKPVCSYPIPYKKYTVSELIKTYNSCVSNVKKYYEDGLKANEYADKFVQLAKTAASRAENTKEAEKAFNCVGILAINELNKIIYQIWFINGAITISKDIAKIVAKDDFKESVFEETVKEYTMLNIVKALNLENFTLESTRALAKEYASKK